MIDVYKSLIRNQYAAAFQTLQHGVDKCSDATWNRLVCNHVFCQSVFHALFFADVYLGTNPESVESQPFHQAHESVFAGYEEWEDRNPEKRYDRGFVQLYIDHCRDKAQLAIEAMTEESLSAPSGFDWIQGTMAEVHVYNIRHIQHHAAQLSLRLRIDDQVDVPWVKSGWVE